MGWKQETDCKSSTLDKKELWERLMYRALGLPDNFSFLPYSPDYRQEKAGRVFQGLKRTIVGSAGTRNIATISKWEPENFLLKVSVYSERDENREIWQHLTFTVEDGDQAGHSKACLVIDTRQSRVQLGIRGNIFSLLDYIIDTIQLKPKYNFAEGVLGNAFNNL